MEDFSVFKNLGFSDEFIEHLNKNASILSTEPMDNKLTADLEPSSFESNKDYIISVSNESYSSITM